MTTFYRLANIFLPRSNDSVSSIPDSSIVSIANGTSLESRKRRSYRVLPTRNYFPRSNRANSPIIRLIDRSNRNGTSRVFHRAKSRALKKDLPRPMDSELFLPRWNHANSSIELYRVMRHRGRRILRRVCTRNRSAIYLATPAIALSLIHI